ncbi:MAG: M28 family peptidase [Firmicutes bacterium]|nr:M28 family peptidase [Bacillota bacterium]
MNDPILTQYQVRKSNKEKTAFIDYLKNRLNDYDITVEENGKGVFKSRNIVVGNPEEAQVILTAHYDTCPVIPFPNLMAPTNPLIFIAYQLLLVVIMVLIGGVFAVPAFLLSHDPLITYYAFLAGLLLFLGQVMFGYPNKHTANDNTSGIIVLTQFLERLPQACRDKICVVYFDNEEKGLLGSSAFAKAHEEVTKTKLLVNLDCVGDGDNIVCMAKFKARKEPLYDLLAECMQESAGSFDGRFLQRKMKFMMFPSDQAHFAKGVGICALRKSPIGMYCARIHTPMDTRCREENVEYLVTGLKKFAERME